MLLRHHAVCGRLPEPAACVQYALFRALFSEATDLAMPNVHGHSVGTRVEWYHVVPCLMVFILSTLWLRYELQFFV